MTVRFSRGNPCPICGGYQSLPQHRGQRCYGYLDDAGTYARCTREEYAGPIQQNNDGTYSHRLAGPCHCGREHGPAASAPERRYQVRNQRGELVAVHARQDRNGGKAMWWESPDGQRTLDGLGLPHLPLYGAELISARPGDTVWITEGEKAADALRSLGLLVVGTVCGAPSTPSDDTLSILAGRDVVLWPDHDDQGSTHMQRIAERLRGVATTVRTVHWPDAPPKGDASEFVAGGGTAEQARRLLSPSTASTPSTRVTGWSASDLMAMEFPPPKWAINDLIPEGLTILAGKPKVGKSWLVLGMALAVANGDKALDAIKVAQGDVLYLALEDTGRRLQSRLGAMLGRDRAPDRLRLELSWPRSNERGIELLDEWLTDHDGARLVIIDTLAKFRPVTRENGYSQDYAAIEPLQQLAGRHGVAVVVIHHQRKLGSEDWVDMISGTLGLAGAADGMIGIFRTRGEEDALLRLTGRDVDDARYGIRWRQSTASWTMIDAAQVQLSAERQAILDFLAGHGPQTPSRIADGLGKNPSTIRTLLQRMSEQEQLEAGVDGTYATPSAASRPSTPSTASTPSTERDVDAIPSPSPPPSTDPVDGVDSADSRANPYSARGISASTNDRSAVDAVAASNVLHLPPLQVGPARGVARSGEVESITPAAITIRSRTRCPIDGTPLVPLAAGQWCANCARYVPPVDNPRTQGGAR